MAAEIEKAAAHSSLFWFEREEDNRAARRRHGNYCWSQPICSASRFVIRNSKTPREFAAERNTLKERKRLVLV